VLDLGCGIGGPARTIASTYNCKVVGITNSAWHVERGTALTKKAGLDHLVSFVKGDFVVCSPVVGLYAWVIANWGLCRNCPFPTIPSMRLTRSSRCAMLRSLLKSTVR
jgi:hypothetical protein